MGHDAWFFVAIFVFIFLVWIAVGGPMRPISFTGPSLALPDKLGGGTYLSLPRAPFGIGGSDIALPGSTEGGGSLDPYTPSFPDIFGPASSHRGQVRMNRYVSGAGADPNGEYIEVSAQGSSAVNISGWKLVSDSTGASAVIPKGTEVPRSGVINAADDIMLAPGTRAIIASGASPIGASFRENKCIGYFSSFQKFTPVLPQTCPVPTSEIRAFYGPGYSHDDACIDYADSLERCEVALSPPARLSSACQSAAMKYLNYNGCIETHLNDQNFKGDTWRIYLGRSTPLWRAKRETVRLLDAQGNTVDAFSY